MKADRYAPVRATTKAPSGIAASTKLPPAGCRAGRTTLLVGGPGSGKTIFALQFLVHGAQALQGAGNLRRLRRILDAHRGQCRELRLGSGTVAAQKKLYFMDAQPTPDRSSPEHSTWRDARARWKHRRRPWGRAGSCSMPWMSYWR
jgi:circadian clock protein KaiC